MKPYHLLFTLVNLSPREIDLLSNRVYNGKLTHLGAGNYRFEVCRVGHTWLQTLFIVKTQLKKLGINYNSVVRVMNCGGVS